MATANVYIRPTIGSPVRMKPCLAGLACFALLTACSPPDRPAPKAADAAPAQMDMQMKSMQEMHEKMMAAKTPEERQTLMAEHMKAMQGGMAMMGQMKMPDAKGSGKSMSPEMMGKRMDMMEMMMQMMMDREAARTPAGK